MRNNSNFQSMLTKFIALILFILISPLFLLIVIAVKVSSKGPVFFASKRAGLDGKVFPAFKFRTMYHGPDTGVVITAPQDDRITSFGRLLRNSKLDELPQLLNIVRGDMVFIGPRPEAPEIVEKYYDEEMHKTLLVKPGLTGAGTLLYLREFRTSVSGDNTVASYADTILQPRLNADLAYIRDRTMSSDIGLLWRTGTFIFSRIFRSSNRE